MKWCRTVLVLLTGCLIFCCAESNQCSNGTLSCSKASTCCPLSDGNFGCCPIANAVCCEDSLHCCPHGYVCDVKEGMCKIGAESVPLVKKIPATPISNEIGAENVIVCPGGEGQCPNDHSCCTVPESNEVHCCPAEHSCDQGICKQTKLEFPAAVLLTPTAEVVKCNQKFACPDRYTCCSARQDYLCCPFQEALCCSDKSHCCPRGFKCSPDSKSCSSGSLSIVSQSTVSARTARMGLSRFLKQMLKVVSKEWLSRTVERRRQSFPMKDKASTREARVICPGDELECPDNNTCCKSSSGVWGCCSFPKAVCCSDGHRCCPTGYTCDLSHGTCNMTGKTVRMVQKIPALKKVMKLKNVICPDEESECKDGETCCKLSSGEYGCCPLPHAVCCSDGLHCCPSGYKCDVEAGTCITGFTSLPVLQKGQTSNQNNEVRPELVLLKTGSSVSLKNYVVCPGGIVQCFENETCCKLSSGEYGCCPVPEAVCCSDGEHCCPKGYACDQVTKTCTQGRKNLPLLRKIPALKRVSEEVVVCPDGSECPDNTTCCELVSGGYGCCLYAKAVCCSDKIHCCPHGYSCDVSEGTCVRGSVAVLMLQRIQTAKKALGDVVCGDGSAQCPDGYTCCKLASGKYGCCPLPNAVCCSDGKNCCPEGFTCNLSTKMCSRGGNNVPLLRKIPALKRDGKESLVVCPGGQSECPDGTTCCELASGEYGCCPLPKAVCCSDKIHCCPHGYVCVLSNGTCSIERTSKEELAQSTIFASKLSLEAVAIGSRAVVCPNKKYRCPDGSTCCKQHSGSYGCCPKEKAICCTDDIHCCPQGYTCDVKRGTCDTQGEQVRMVANVPAVVRKMGYVECPDRSRCLDDETCCRTSDKEYGCCPLPHAVCCEDKVHCCPSGYRCDAESQSCVAGSVRIPMLAKTKSTRREKSEEVNIDEKIHFTPGKPQDGNPEDVGFL